MDISTIVSQLMILVLALSVVVDIITEIAKNTFNLKNTRNINVIVLIMSLIITFASLMAYWQIHSLDLTWYVISAFLVIGIFVAYAAMFGYDKFISQFKPFLKESE